MSHEVDSDLVRRLAALLEETGLGELEYATNDWKIRLARPTTSALLETNMNIPVTTTHAPMPNTEELNPEHQDDQILKSPMVGTAYLTPDPSSSPFVNIGDRVEQGDTVMIIEAMKVMNPILAHRSGVVTEILVKASEPVEFNQGLLIIE
ncbi:MAG: acetyl-CoA carboxylase, biotin carboxyl carrier protein [Rhodospirillaceae bacterium]|nr:acetyl-CoA carboxylase, biotin carboxyl carrier protein [Rhodospirillaceae bacterium]